MDNKMTTNNYDHQPITGLPASLLKREGSTVAVLALMQREGGLNRDLRRELASEIKATPRYEGGPGNKHDKVEMKLMGFFVFPDARFDAFWHAARHLSAGERCGSSIVFALALDLPLLHAYDPNWLQLALDDEAIAATCPEWSALKQRIGSKSKRSLAEYPLQAVMLWPRLLQDLERWQDLSPERRQAVGWAVYSMSSITLSDWFIRTALARCPELEDELGSLLPERGDADKPPVGIMGSDLGADDITSSRDQDAGKSATVSAFAAEVVATPIAPAATTVSALSINARWFELVESLEVLSAELQRKPSRNGVADLIELSRLFENLLPLLPDEEAELAAVCRTRIADLLGALRQLQQEPLFAWLDDRLIEQIGARWEIALRGCTGNDGFPALQCEMEAAIERGTSARDSYRAGVETYNTLAANLLALQVELDGTHNLAERRVLERRKTTLKMDEVNADAALPTLQDELLSAWSPQAATFEHSVDYKAELARAEQSAVSAEAADPAASRTEELNALPEETVVVTEAPAVAAVAEPVEPTELTEPAVPTAAAAAAAITAGKDLTELPTPTHVTEPEKPAMQVSLLAVTAGPAAVAVTVTAEDDGEFTLAAGERCRPIWQLLRAGELSLAYQLARALDQEPDAPKVPYPPLLASVALASQLVLPDGGVQHALGTQFAELNAEWFSADEPHDWRAALNLLLAAATLRAMIFAPSTGASSIAGYSHLDGKYATLYSLVERLRYFGDRLQGFRIEPATLKLARGETAIHEDLQALQVDANDWLRVQAPAVTIKFHAATRVWAHWLKPQGVISQLVAPVISNRHADLQRVRELVATLADSDDFLKLVHDTDRREIGRRNGDEIHAGALDHLTRCTGDAITLARRWITLVDAGSQTGNRMRTLLQEVRAELSAKRHAIEEELQRSNDVNRWELTAAAQAVVLAEFRSIWNLFDPSASLPPLEPSPDDVLGNGLLLTPALRVADDWSVANDARAVSAAIAELVRVGGLPVDRRRGFEARLKQGDLYGAERLAQRCGDQASVDAWTSEVRREIDGWRSALRRAIEDARREVEVGLAYGTLSEAEHSANESRLVQWEAEGDDLRRFDEAIASVNEVNHSVRRSRDKKTTEVRQRLAQIKRTPATEAGIDAIDRELEQGDIATANELLQRLASGLPAWPEAEAAVDRFANFFPTGMKTVSETLEKLPRGEVELAMREGQTLPGLDFSRNEKTQRDQAATMFAAWADLKSRKQGEPGRMTTLLTGLGFEPQKLTAGDKVGGREFWALDATPIEDRAICPIPHYGSSARGRYRLICLWEKPTEDDIVQIVGESALQRATLVLYFGRMSERRWRDTSRTAKVKSRAFLLVDEVMLTRLCAETGPRLGALFDLALPFSYAAPYDATAGLVPPEMFYGRSAELDAVRGLNGRCFIYGGRQLGKTASLRRAERSFHDPAAHRYSRWIDLRAEGIGVNKTPADLWICVTEQLKSIGVFNDTIVIPNPAKKGSVEKVLAALRDFLGANLDRRILLLLDEADYFFEQDGRGDFAETRRLKQLMDDTGRRFKVVFAGLHNVLRMTERANHPLAHFGEPIKIGPLVAEQEVREAEDLIRRPLAAAGFALESRSLAVRILAQTNYYPSLIQLYCSHLLRHMLAKVSGPHPVVGPRYAVTNRDIDSVYASGALRDEIRLKFGLTLKLDQRYEVVAFALAYDMLRGRYAHAEGMDWQTIRQNGAMYWWPEGFRETTELDFRVLLDEMVELGVLSRIGESRYTLRNPNVLLLLGTLSEIEAGLERKREPALEFESAVFRAPSRADPASPHRSPLTYQQLSELLRPANSVTILTGTEAGGVADVAPALQDYLGQAGDVLTLDDCQDRQAFVKNFDRVLRMRDKDTTLIVVPPSVPWSAGWVQEAQQKLARLSSESKFVSTLFVANPAGLWGAIDDAEFVGMDVPWMSLMPWHDAFVRQWLQDLHLPDDVDLRRKLLALTGYWPALLYDLVDGGHGLAELNSRIEAATAQQGDAEIRRQKLLRLGLDVPGVRALLEVLVLYGEPVQAQDLAVIAETPLELVLRTLRWADLLGLALREGGDFWSVDARLHGLLATASNAATGPTSVAEAA